MFEKMTELKLPFSYQRQWPQAVTRGRWALPDDTQLAPCVISIHSRIISSEE